MQAIGLAPHGTSGRQGWAQRSGLAWLVTPALRPMTALAVLVSLVLNLTMIVPSVYMLLVFDRVFSSRSLETLTMLTLLAAIGLALLFLMDVARGLVLAAAGRVLDARLGALTLRAMLDDAAAFGGAKHPGLARDAGMLRAFVSGNGIFALFDAPWLPVYLLVIFLFHPVLGAVASLAALMLFGLVVLSERRTRRPAEQALDGSRRTTRFVDAAMRNAEAVRGMGMAGAVQAHWGLRHAAVLDAQAEMSRTGGPLSAFVRTFRLGVQVAMLGIGAWLVIGQHLTPGVMIASTILLARALQPIELLVTGWKMLLDARGAWERLVAAPLAPPDEGRVELPVTEARLAVEQVVFGAGPNRPAVLKSVSLTIAPGETLGLIGPSASGKTTLARVILGIWQPQSGVVRLDGADVAGWPRDQLGPQLGYLPQDVELFAGTVAENIARLGEVDSQAVIKAAQLAGAHEMILRLPQGYETEVGESGANLSGGQRQRIGLARALFGGPRLVVLDEPNANLDSDGESALVAALAELKAQGTTVLLIGHRPAMMTGVDRIAVLVDGRLETVDTPQAVMARYTQPPRVAAAGGRQTAGA